MTDVEVAVIPSFLSSLSLITVGLLLVTILLQYVGSGGKYTRLIDAPVVGKYWRWEPEFITKYRFVTNGWAIVHEGWKKHGNSAFTILRPDSNITVVPQRYVRELQNLGNDVLHPIEALSQDVMGDYTGMNILVGSHLNFNVIRNKLTPKLGDMTPIIEDEMRYAIKREMPPCRDEWKEIDLNNIMTRVISRMTSRTWIGDPLCRNDDWHSTNLSTTEQIFITALALRLAPRFLQPFFHRLLPSRLKLRKGIEKVHSYLIPIIHRRQHLHQYDEKPPESPHDVLQWMIDLADEDEKEPQDLATRYVFAVIGSLFTVSSSLVDCLYDLIEQQGMISKLRIEAESVLSEDSGWKKGTEKKLEMLDSFMKESQRVNPPSPLSFKRIVRRTITLSDGLVLPKGAYICVVTSSHFQVDDGTDAAVFDGLRYYKKTQAQASNSRYQYSSTDNAHISFGHGRYACPGRFVASAELKMVLVHMLLNYDLKFVKGKISRPKNLHFLELGLQDPSVRVLIQERRKASQ
ncbi:cytochrome P450 [Tricladium varicosporioides]|nr:cytochrome P450 [Hymenoscyphus varicosporioides]